jgi:YgiT-type zinc finger domain-containing protein
VISRRTHVPPRARNCLHCGTKRLDAALVRYLHRLGVHALIVEDVPCLRCPECGEEYFDIATLKLIESAHNAILDHERGNGHSRRLRFEELGSR